MDLLTHAVSGAVVGAALAPDNRTRAPLMIVGAVASLMPDLDAMAGRAGPAAAWRHHRVALHGVAMVPVLALPLVMVVAGSARTGLLPTVPMLALSATVIGAILVHLLLDTLTSFGTALLYPFSRRRFSTHTHFIVDVPLLACLAWGLMARRPGAALLACAMEIVCVIVWRTWLLTGARRALERRHLHPLAKVSVEPGPLSPFRWSVVALFTNGSVCITASMWPGALAREVKMISRTVPDEALERARIDPLVAAYLDTVDFLHAEWIGDDNGPRALVIEDLKWRVHDSVRPLCLTLPWRGDRPNGKAQELPMFWRAPALNTQSC